MAAWTRRPRADTIVCTDKEVTNVYSVITIGQAPQKFPVDEAAASPTPVMGAQRVGEGG